MTNTTTQQGAESPSILELRDLFVSVAQPPHTDIVKGVSLTIRPGEIHALMGPNGSGKSTLASAIAGSPAYKVDSGQILFKGEDVAKLSADERARRGMFLSFQYPTPIPGVTMVNLLRLALKARRGQEPPAREFLQQLRSVLATLRIEEDFARRYVNEGFSGGEKKRAEILQMAVLKPEIAIMDETDSGLDIDALKVVANGVNALRREDPSMAVVLITHYQRLLDYIKPDIVHVMVDGRIVRSGGPEVALWLEEEGYASWREAEEKAAVV